MSDTTFYDKTVEYMKRIEAFEEKGDFLNSVAVIEEARKYMDDVIAKELDATWQLYYKNYSNVWGLLKHDFQIRNDFEIYKKETNIAIKELQQKIRELENE